MFELMGLIVAVFVIIAIVMAVAFGATIFLAARTVRAKNRATGSFGGFQGDGSGPMTENGLPPTAMEAEQRALWQNTINTNAALEQQTHESHPHAAPAADTIHHHGMTHHQAQSAPEAPHDIAHAAAAYQPPPPMPDLPAPPMDTGMHHSGHGL